MSKFNSIILTVGLMLLSTTLTLAQEKEKEKKPPLDSRNVITTYPFGLISGSLLTGYERDLGNGKSVKFLLGLTSADYSRYYRKTNVFELYNELQFRFYLGEKKDFGGFFAGPFLVYKIFEYEKISYNYNTGVEVSTSHSASSAALGYIIGYQILTRWAFSLDYYMGAGFRFPSGDYSFIDNVPVNTYNKGAYYHTGLSLGINF